MRRHRRSHELATRDGHLEHIALFHKVDLDARGGRLFPHLLTVPARVSQKMVHIETHQIGDDALEIIYVLEGKLGCAFRYKAKDATFPQTVYGILNAGDCIVFDNVLEHGFFSADTTQAAKALHLLYSLSGAPGSYERT